MTLPSNFHHYLVAYSTSSLVPILVCDWTFGILLRGYFETHRTVLLQEKR